MFDLDYDPTQYKRTTILMGDFLKPSTWSEGLS